MHLFSAPLRVVRHLCICVLLFPTAFLVLSCDAGSHPVDEFDGSVAVVRAALDDDESLCRAGDNYILGTSGDDVLVGTSGPDCIVGYGGNDHLSGLGGDDLLIGGAGDDVLEGGDGHDDLYGGTGNDHLIGGDEWDYLSGGEGNDRLEGNAGDNKLFGGPGDDWLDGGGDEHAVWGGDGCDIIDARAGQGTLRGEGGNDLIQGGNDPWVVEGGDGDDIIASGIAPSFAITGGDGNDECDGEECEASAPASCVTNTDCASGRVCHLGVGLCVPEGHCSLGESEPGTDTTCDGVDDDSDESIDEDYVSQPTTCGVGPCASSGSTSCVSGSVVDSCTPGTPSPSDATCNGIDDDCDGANDEDFTTHCEGSAIATCVSGVETADDCDDGDACTGLETCEAASCVPGAPPVIDDGNPCTSDSCDPELGAVHTPVAAGTSCADGDVCNGAEECDGAGACIAGTSLDLDDDNPCTIDACDPLQGVSHEPAPSGTSCEDAEPCDGAEECDGAGTCIAGPLPATGPCVPAGPTAAIFVDESRLLHDPAAGASVVSNTGTSAPLLSAHYLSWTPNGTAPVAELVLDLASDAAVVLNHVVVTGAGNSGALRHFEIWVSETGSAPTDFVRVLEAEHPQGVTDPITYDLAGRAARFIQLRIVDNWLGQAGRGAVQRLTLHTGPRDGGAISLHEAGVTATATSSSANARYAIDLERANFWQNILADTTPSITIDLPGDDWHLVDRVAITTNPFFARPLRNFEIWISSTGTDEADFTQVFTGQMQNTEPVRDLWFFFTPTPARYVRLRALDNAAGGTQVGINGFRVHSAHEGGRTVSFQDRSVPGVHPIIWWDWDFGDGDRSALRNPTHTFPGAGSYLVSLEVTDAYGVRSRAEYLYEAHEGPGAFFTWTPDPVRQGNAVQLRDRSVSDSPLVRIEWNVDGVASTTSPGGLAAYTATQIRPFVASVTATDSSLLRDTFVVEIPVENMAPTINVGTEQTLVWGQAWSPLSSPSITDASSADSNSLRCDWDFGDGTTDASPLPCTASNFYVSHGWASPGSYEVVATVSDPSGGQSEDSFFVLVTRRPTEIGLDAIEGVEAGGSHEVVARLMDSFEPGAPMAGRSIELRVGAQVATVLTDASGAARASFDFTMGTSALVEASFAGDSLYFASAYSGIYPEDLPPSRRASCGRELWLAVPHLNHEGEIAENTVFFTAERETTATLRLGSWTANVRVPVRGTARVNLPPDAEITASGAFTSQGIHVESSREICATVMMYSRFSTDSYLGLAKEGLGREYVVSAYERSAGIGLSGAVIIATEDDTDITVIPSTTLQAGASLPSTTAGVPFVVQMDRGQTLQLRGSSAIVSDLTGTRISATAPIGVIGGNSCARVPVDRIACDTIAEQIPPVETLGTEFLVTPFAGRTSGYIVRTVAASDDTEVRVDGSLVATLDAGQFHSLSVTNQTPRLIEASAPALVTQYARGGSTDGVGDPFQMTIVPTNQFGRDFVVTTVLDYAPAPGVSIDFQHRLTILAESGATGGVRLNGAPVTAAFQSIGASGWAYAHVTVESGEHRISHISPGALVGVYAYGWSTYESYGHPGFMRLEPNEACTPSATVPGNGRDDDCDGGIDEEDANGIDDDGDGLIDEDLEFVSGPVANLLPIAYETHVGTREDVPVSFVVSAFDSNGDALSFEVVSSPSHGALSGTAPSLTYTPSADYVGSDSFTFRACDGSGCSSPAVVTLSIAGANDPPDIQMSPLVTGLQGSLLTLPCVANDVDLEPGCALEWSLVSGPPGMSIDRVTGDVYWVPDETTATVSATVRVTDCHGASANFTFGVDVVNREDPPVITSTPIRSARFNSNYYYDVHATDPDPGDTVTFQLLEGPTGMSIVTATGLISWAPTSSDAGTHRVRVVAIDGSGLFSQVQEFDLVVAGDSELPRVNLSVSPAVVLPNETATIYVTASDNDDVIIESVTVGGTPIVLSAGVGTFSSPAPGVFEVIATAVDPTGNRNTDRGAVRVRVAGDDAAPVVELTAPEPDSELTYLHEVTGSVEDDHLHRYTLDVRLADRQSWRTLASGTSNISGVLGTLDTTQLENGMYFLRLRAEDVNGRVGEDIVPIRVSGGGKVGLVQLSFTDLVTSDFGLPLAVIRRYDSRLQGRGDFGMGWDLELRHGSVQHNRTVGQGIAIYTRQGDFIPCQRTEEQLYHFTEVRLSETEWYLFRPTIVDPQPIAGGCGGTVVFEQIDGVRGGAELVPFGHSEVRATAISPIAAGSFVQESNLTNTITGELYQPQSFRLTLADGRILDLSMRDGITRIEDRHGNWVRIVENGMSHSSGRSLHFVRDAQRRITQAIDSAGRSTGYEYDVRGNLVAFTDVLGRRTRYEYRNAAYPHHLTHIIDHRGVVMASLDFHDDGRLERMCDADGVCTRSNYDLGARAMVITDGLGQPTQYAYDQRGNVTDMVDALGNHTRMFYSAAPENHLIRREDPTGAITTYAYDPFTGQMSERVDPHRVGEDPEDFTTQWTYDSHGEVLTEQLPTGGTHHYERDPNGEELALRDDAGRVIRSRTYNVDGTVASSTDRFGTRMYEYADPSGRPSRITDPQGRVFELAYDPSGNVERVTSGAVTMQYRYDAAGRRVYADFGRGITLRYEYVGGTNDWSAIEGPTVGRVERTVSYSGRVTAWRMPNGDTFSRTYDALGRLRESVNELGNITRQYYDDAGRLERIEDIARGSNELFVRDGNGQPLSITDREGHTTTITRDPRGGLSSYTNALSATWSFDNGSTESSMTTPSGETTLTHRGAYGLTTGQTLPGGATTSSAHVGNTSIDESYRFPLSNTDESGRARNFTYDSFGGLDTATDLGSGAWAYDYDAIVAGDLRFDVESGRVWLASDSAAEPVYGLSSTPDDIEELEPYSHALSTVTSPEGETTRWSRDASGRIDLIEYPHGGTEVRTYDAVDGQLETVTLPHGVTLEYDIDVSGRVLERSGSDSSLITYSYGAGNRVTEHSDATGTTTHHYDGVGRYAGLTQPTGASVRFERDRLDRIDAVRVREPGASTDRETEYVYDAAGNLTEIHDPLGGVTTMTYDASGRLVTRTLPNGVVSTWTYDVRSRVASITHATSTSTVIASVAYLRAPSGEPTRITREDGSYVTYGYDDALRLERETYFDASNAQIDEITYAYDLDGNRTRRNTTSGEEVYSYSSGSRLTNIAISGVPTAEYAYDAAGRVTEITRGTDERILAWDADDHVTSISRGTQEMRFDFDAQGRRVRAERRNAGVTTDTHRYLIAPTLAEDLESPHLATTDAGTPRTGWVFQGEHPLFRYDPVSGKVIYYLADSMGSTIGLVDGAASSSSTIHYDGFGNERSATGSLATLPVAAGGDFRFQGMWLDQDTGLYYVRARSYEPETGRFLSRDPALGAERKPETWIAYGFSAANPVLFRDPTGRTYATTMLDIDLAAGIRGVLNGLSVSRFAVAWLRALRLAVQLGLDLFPLTVALDNLTQISIDQIITDNEKFGCAQLGLSRSQCRAAIHAIKDAAGLGGADNVRIDTETGDVYDRDTGEYIGNLLEEAGL